MTLTEALMMLLASFAGGMVNSIAGGGTLITFPVLLAVGLDSRTANATSSLALFSGSASAMYGYRRELHSSRTHLIRLGAASLAGGATGAGLLLVTPSEIFDRLVPFLILFATLLFAAGDTISRKLGGGTSEDTTIRSQSTLWWTGALAAQFATAVYGGYFGAGMGIAMLATLNLIGVKDIHGANGIKNFLAVCINGIAVAGLALGGLIRFAPALLMAAGATAGGYFGARVAHRLGKTFVRRAVIAIGLAIGTLMLWRLWR